jgi:hypothetical protein
MQDRWIAKAAERCAETPASSTEKKSMKGKIRYLIFPVLGE